jgi:riboflavin synthase
MFTGIVEKTVRIAAVVDSASFRRLSLSADWTDVVPGESIAINGCCLTVAQILSGRLDFDVITETLEKTNLGQLIAGDEVNVERSLRVGDRLSGHFVQGHVDGVARLTDIKPTAGEYRLTIAAPIEFAKYIVPKGSVTVDGVSLTVASLHDNSLFDVALIPTTLSLTTLGQKKIGWLFNLETDVLSKTIVSYLERRSGF